MLNIIETVITLATASGNAGAYDMTDLATIKDELEITDGSQDTRLQRYITEMSSAMSAYCNRVFAIETVQDLCYIEQDPYPWQTPGGFNYLQLQRWPFYLATPVNFTGNTHGTNTVDGITSTTGIVQGALVFALDGSIPAGTTVATVSTNSITMSNAATTSVTGQTLYTGMQVIQTIDQGLTTQTLVAGTDYTVDAAKGWLIRLDPLTGNTKLWEAVPTAIQYQAGYANQATVAKYPADLISATLRLVTARFRAKGRDPAVVEQTQPGVLGTQRYWVGRMPGQVGPFPPEITSVLDPYRVPIAGS